MSAAASVTPAATAPMNRVVPPPPPAYVTSMRTAAVDPEAHARKKRKVLGVFFILFTIVMIALIMWLIRVQHVSVLRTTLQSLADLV